MGRLEKDSRKRTRIRNLQKIVLETVAVAGVLSVALVAPNALIVLKKLGLSPKPRQKEIFNLSRHRLVKHGLLEYSGRGFLKLTPKGETKLRQLELYDYKIKKPRRWDKKWRVLIFDVKEERRATREKLRRTLTAIGFTRLQDSVWVYPYDCEDLITLLKADFKIGRELLYMISDSIENDQWLRESFGLPVS
ncbi:MAG: CRISPR-associated endonuclease Cas2 [bacterium]|nr:CRISPR-associated endonuclease Cas2 [bacterium]